MKRNHFPESVQFLSLIFATIFVFSMSGCFTVGHDFPVNKVTDIKIGKTTQNDIRSMFGSPWRVGIEDGQTSWTYGKYRYSAFSEASTQDLVIKFNSQGIVTSYTFNTTEHPE